MLDPCRPIESAAQIKHARGFRQFLLRGFDKMKAEWAMICNDHNLLNLANAKSEVMLSALAQFATRPKPALPVICL